MFVSLAVFSSLCFEVHVFLYSGSLVGQQQQSFMWMLPPAVIVW